MLAEPLAEWLKKDESLNVIIESPVNMWEPDGDGVIRVIEFLEPLSLSILSQRRGPYPPYGCDGGEPGSLGSNRLVRASGGEEPLAACVETNVHPGDCLVLKTPGGGGWGSPNPRT